MHPFLEIKTNPLRRLPGGDFVLNDRRYPDSLCRACAHFNTCPIASTVTRCGIFAPVFVFQNADNLDQPQFNTIRLGQAWFNRLVEGSKIGVYIKPADTLMLYRVTSLYWLDDKAELLRHHAARNHLGMTLPVPAVDLERKLRSMYGNNFYNKAKGLTAIYLSPCTD